MAFSITNYSRVWVRGRLVDLAKAAREVTNYGVTGPIQFIPTPDVLIDATTKQIIDPTPFVAYPAATDGYFAVQLPATNDPDINPSSWNYKVIEPTGRTYFITVPYNTSNLSSVGDPLNGQPVLELSSVTPDANANSGTVQVIAGVDGRGVTGASINGSSHLILTMSDSTTIDAGAIVAGIDAEGARDAVGTALTASTGMTVTVNDGADTITLATTAILPTLVDAKGDLLVGTADNTVARQAVGSNAQVLTADSTVTNGIKWAAIPSVYVTDTPTKHGYVEWNYDPALTQAGSGTAAVSGSRYLMKLSSQTGGTISNIICVVGTAGATLTSGQNLGAIYDSTGTRVAVTTDQTTAFGSTGVKSMALASSITMTAGQDYYVALLSVGSTPASFVRGGPTSMVAPNAGLSATALRFSINGTSVTSMATSLTLSSNSGTNAQAYWVALS